MRVLIVDDSGVMRKMLARELQKMNFAEEDMVQATDGEEGVRKALSESFDLILMDWNMPNMLGIDAVRAIREADNQTPILMVTTESERTNVVTAIQAGANNYLVKPFNEESFQAKVMQLIGSLVEG